MKKVLSAALCGCMAASLALTGCSTGASGGASDGGKEDVTLLWYTEGDQPDDLQMVLDKVNPILKEKIGATVDIRFISNADYDEKMTSVINSGEPYDICFTCDWANSYAINARKGAYLDLTPYLDGDNKALKEAVDSRCRGREDLRRSGQQGAALRACLGFHQGTGGQIQSGHRQRQRSGFPGAPVKDHQGK